MAWLDGSLAEAGIERTGAVEPTHARPWATVLRAPTSRGTVWMKAAAPATAFEAGLYELLRRVAPDMVLEPLAVDVARGWILLPDGGRSLGERASGPDLVDALATILPRYGELQRAVAPHVDDLLALGVTDMRPAVMPRRFDEAVEAARAYVERGGDPADRTAYERVGGMRETVVSWCERLARAPVAPSIDHNDLHPRNVLVGDGDGIGPARFYDWGDAVVAHPFASMLLALGFVKDQIDGSDLRRLRDAYLEVFADLGSHADLLEALELACRVGKVARTLTLHRAFNALGPDHIADDWLKAAIAAMASLLDDSYLARI